MWSQSPRVGMVIPGTKVEVSWSVKKFGLERADALRRSSAERHQQGQRNPGPVPEPKGCCLFFWLLGRGAVVWSFLHRCGASLSGCGGGLQTFFSDMTGFATEQTQVVVHATLSFFLSEPTIFPKLQSKGRGRLGGARRGRGRCVLGCTGLTRLRRICVRSDQGSGSFAFIAAFVLQFVCWSFTSDF